MATVLVLGSNGMLGCMVSSTLEQSGHRVIQTERSGSGSTLSFEVGDSSIFKTFADVGKIDYVINAIGIIKPRIDENGIESRREAIQVNSIFPHQLSEIAERLGFHVIQIATDCVYSGTTGLYNELSPHDALDVYGKTKSLGEVPSNHILHLRASIIGPELGRQTSLWEWVRNQDRDAEIGGYTNHKWNGVTTFHFGMICNGIINAGLKSAGLQHVVPNDMVTKAELVKQIATVCDRADIVVNEIQATDFIDRTLSTVNPEMNRQLWDLAGYASPPTVLDMVAESPTAIG